jgi:hypothetical protein
MPFDRSKLVSAAYWKSESNRERTAQRFYVAFCLLMSSIQDAMLGLREHEVGNRNWSATCSYYSLVHGGRLLAFLALGDFPKGHDRLAQLLSGREGRIRLGDEGLPERSERWWLKGFTSSIWSSVNVSVDSPYGELARADLREGIVAYLNEIEVGDPAIRLSTYGRILEAGRNLRTDSNYEALLIAHEYSHRRISEAFDRLAAQMARAVDSCLPLAKEAFKAYVTHDTDIRTDAGPYNSFLADYLQVRIKQAIGVKLGHSPRLQRRLDAHIEDLRPSGQREGYADLERAADEGIFAGKVHLMDEFEGKIRALTALIGEALVKNEAEQ